MNFSVEKSVIEEMLASLQAFLEKKDNSEITSHIILKVKDNSLFLKATDKEIGLEAKTDEIIVKEEGIATCNGKKILDIIRILKEEEINISRTSSDLHIKQNKTKYKLSSYNADEFPSFPQEADLPKIDINSAKLISAFKKINPGIATNNPKIELNGALIDIKNSVINVVATDTKRLAVQKIDNVSDKIFSIIIPKRAISEIQKIFDSNIEIYYDKVNFIIKNEKYFFFSRVINGKFPPYESIIPREFKHSFTLPKIPVIEAIRQVNILFPDIKITFSSSGLVFESLSKDNSEAATNIDMSLNLEAPFSMAINSRFLIDFLSNVDTDTFTININEPNTAFKVDSDNFFTIIMPINL